MSRLLKPSKISIKRNGKWTQIAEVTNVTEDEPIDILTPEEPYLKYDVNQALESFVPEPQLTDLMQLPKVEKKMIQEARKQMTERELRRKKQNHDPKRRHKRDALMNEYNSLNSQRLRNYVRKQANKNQKPVTPIKPQFENDECTSTTETSTTPSQTSAVDSAATEPTVAASESSITEQDQSENKT